MKQKVNAVMYYGGKIFGKMLYGWLKFTWIFMLPLVVALYTPVIGWLIAPLWLIINHKYGGFGDGFSNES